MAMRPLVVDRSIETSSTGSVNGVGRVTIISSWLSGFTDKRVVDGLVNLCRPDCAEKAARASRRLQTGLVQNYALLMLFGIFRRSSACICS